MNAELEWKLSRAKERLAAAHEAKTAAERLSERARELGGGLLSFGGSGKQSAKRTVQGAQGRAFEAHNEADARIAKWEHRIRSLERRIETQSRVQLTFEDVKGASLIRTSNGWHRVVRVNAKSVTVETAYSWTDRYPIERILEVRRDELKDRDK